MVGQKKGTAKKSASSSSPPRKASPASIASRRSYLERRPMVTFYLDPHQIEFIDVMRRASEDHPVPSASGVIRAMVDREIARHEKKTQNKK